MRQLIVLTYLIMFSELGVL